MAKTPSSKPAKGAKSVPAPVAAPAAVAGTGGAAAGAGVRVEYMRLDALPPAAEVNPKKHDIPSIKASLARFGFVAPPAVNESTNRLLAGHGRIEAIGELMRAGAAVPARVQVDPADGMWMIPVLRGVRFDTPVEARAYLLADNRLTEVGGWDDDALRAELAAIVDLDGADALLGVGWSDDDVRSLLAEAEKFEAGKEAITSPAEQERFINASIKQVSQFYPAKEYDAVISDMDFVMEREGLKNHSEVVSLLLRQYLERNPRPPQPTADVAPTTDPAAPEGTPTP